MRKSIALVALLLSPVIASAQYTRWTDGYYYLPGSNQAYVQHYIPGYWSYGCYYPGYYYYTAYVYPATTYQAPDFDTQLLNIVKKRELENAKIAKLRAVGITLSNEALTPFLNQTAGYNGAYNYAGHIYNALTPLVNNTFNTSGATFYKDTDLNQLFALQSQHITHAGRLFSESNGLFATNVQTATQAQARIAEINAKRDAMMAFGQTLQPSPVAQSSGYKFAITPASSTTTTTIQSPPLTAAVDPAVALLSTKQAVLQTWVADARTDCAKCHVGPTPKGGFDLETYPSMSQAERKKRVYSRIDPKAADNFRMPRNADGSPGIPFSPQRLQLWQTVEEPGIPPMPNADQPVLDNKK
jgi:hypothetical protein